MKTYLHTCIKITLGLLVTMVFTHCGDDPAYSADYDIQWPVPTIASISPAAKAEVSSTVTLTGTGLDKVMTVTIDNRTMTIADQSETTLHVVLPRRFNTSAITLTNLYRQTVISGTTLSPAYPDITISQFPAAIVKGEPVVINGTNLDLITSVVIGSSVVAISSTNMTKLEIPTDGLKLTAGDDVVVEVGSTFSTVVNGKSGSIPVED